MSQLPGHQGVGKLSIKGISSGPRGCPVLGTSLRCDHCFTWPDYKADEISGHFWAPSSPLVQDAAMQNHPKLHCQGKPSEAGTARLPVPWEMCKAPISAPAWSPLLSPSPARGPVSKISCESLLMPFSCQAPRDAASLRIPFVMKFRCHFSSEKLDTPIFLLKTTNADYLVRQEGDRRDTRGRAQLRQQSCTTSSGLAGDAEPTQQVLNNRAVEGGRHLQSIMGFKLEAST